MAFEKFVARVTALAEASNMAVECHTLNGFHRAKFADGTEIRANDSSHRVSVRWGSGHEAYANLDAALL